MNKNNQHKFYWGKEQRDAANKLKEIISGPDLVLEFPDPTGSYGNDSSCIALMLSCNGLIP
ncbi:unnamed protein product [Rotaria sp. Silwood2]|nr:unnamed protein product [Rotaria sp. Silwood2]